MADIKELTLALAKSKIRLLPLEEHLFLNALNDIEKRILKTLDRDKEVRSPYELN